MKYILLTFLLTGCGHTAIPAALIDEVGIDGYRFLQKQFENLQVSVKVVPLQDEKTLRSIAGKVFGPNGKRIRAFTFWNEKEKSCTIYIKDPSWRYEPEAIGHELAHCVWGSFHKQ